MANIMSFSIGYTDASLTSLKSKNSVNDAAGAVTGATGYLVECALWGKEVTSEGIIHAASSGAVYGTATPVVGKGIAVIANKLRKYL